VEALFFPTVVVAVEAAVRGVCRGATGSGEGALISESRSEANIRLPNLPPPTDAPTDGADPTTLEVEEEEEEAQAARGCKEGALEAKGCETGCIFPKRALGASFAAAAAAASVFLAVSVVRGGESGSGLLPPKLALSSERIDKSAIPPSLLAPKVDLPGLRSVL